MFMFNKIRFLVTNKCNYDCIYCHNEGQSYKQDLMMSYDNFLMVMKYVNEIGICKVTFSGGEPFSHPHIMDMMKYVYDMRNITISCASNASLLDKKKIDILTSYHVNMTVNFPAVDKKSYKEIVGRDYFDKVLANLTLMKENNMFIVLNFVMCDKTKKNFKQVLDFAIKENLNLKILPFMSNKNIHDSSSIFLYDTLYSILDKYRYEQHEDIERARTTWYVHVNENVLRIRTYKNPCIDRSFALCKEVNELRIMPNMNIKTCMFANDGHSIRWNDNKLALEDLKDIWTSFKCC